MFINPVIENKALHTGPRPHRGEVLFFSTSQGYGFIKPKGGGDDVFVHASALRAAGIRDLFPDDIVSFDAADHNGKRRVISIAIMRRAARSAQVTRVGGGW